MFDGLVIAAAVYLTAFPWFISTYGAVARVFGQVVPIFIGAALAASLYARFFTVIP